MSTRVLPVGGFMSFNIRMSELRRRLQTPPVPVTQPEAATNQDQGPSAPQGEHSAPLHQTRSVRRNLFGPIDHDENLKFVQEELLKIADADSRRWNYDFQNDQPLEGRYTWEVPEGATVPVAYNMPNLTSRLTQAINPTPSTSKIVTTIVTTKQSATPVTSPLRLSVPTTTENLQTTLHTVTTASTTVITSVAPTSKEGYGEDPTVPGAPCKHPKEPSDQKALLPKKHTASPAPKQTHITDFLRIRKRARSPSDSEGKGEDAPSPPLLKRTRTST